MSEIPGPRSRAVHHAEREVLAPGVQRIAQLSELTLARGSGAVVEDLDGNRYLDFFAGVAVASLGHSHPRWVAALREQIGRISVGSFTTEDRLAFLRRLREVAPGSLGRTQLYSSGAEAVEAALRLCRARSGRREVVSFWGGFHGKTAGVMGLNGDGAKRGWGPVPAGQTSVPYADCARCPLQLEYPSCGVACADFAREAIDRQTCGDVAAIVVEAVQGTAGNVVPPPEFLRAVASIAKDLGALLVVDEMITGFGRTGRLFGIEHSGVEPDVMTLGKGMGGGYPVSAVLSSDEVVDSPPWSDPSASSSSYGGNPLAATAARVTLDVVLDEGLAAHAAELGAKLLERLREMRERHAVIGDVRGLGLMIGVDFVAARGSRELLPKAVMERVFAECLRRGLLLMGYTARVRIHPPLTITESQALEGLEILDAVLSDLEADGALT